MIQQFAPEEAYLGDERFPRHTIKLSIFQNTSLATISSILLYAVDWKFFDGQTSRNRVLGITWAAVFNAATFTLGDCKCHSLFTPVSAGIDYALIPNGTIHGAIEPQRSETSIRTLLHLSSKGIPTERSVLWKYRLDIQCDYPEDLKVWLQEASFSERPPNDANLPYSFPPGSSGTPISNPVSVYISIMSFPAKISSISLMALSTCTKICGHTNPA